MPEFVHYVDPGGDAIWEQGATIHLSGARVQLHTQPIDQFMQTFERPKDEPIAWILSQFTPDERWFQPGDVVYVACCTASVGIVASWPDIKWYHHPYECFCNHKGENSVESSESSEESE